MFRVFVPLLLAASLACDPHATPVQTDGSKLTAASEDDDLPAFEPTPENLLAAHADRPTPSTEAIDQFVLTRHAKRIIETLVSAAAQGDRAVLKQLVTDDAQWGLPDRAKRGARPLSDRLLDEFIVAFRSSADRFPRRARFRCPPLSPGASSFVAAGAEPMWCAYAQPDELEHLVFELATRDGRAQIQYVGFFEDAPTGRTVVPDKNAPPDHPPMLRRNLEMTRRNVPALDPQMQYLRRLSKRASERGVADADPANELPLPTTASHHHRLLRQDGASTND